MMFSRKKPANTPGSGQPVLRSRENASGNSRENPLARRFHPVDEPDTIDLEDPARFHSAVDEVDPPTTRYLDESEETAVESDERQAHEGLSLLTLDAHSGKFYIQPGEGDVEVLLGGKPVFSPTELRPGDQIKIGSSEFHFL